MRVWLRQTTSTAGLINGFGTTLEWENHCAECAARMSYKAAQHTPCLLTGTHVHEMHTQKSIVFFVRCPISQFPCVGNVVWNARMIPTVTQGGACRRVCVCVCVYGCMCMCVHVYMCTAELRYCILTGRN